ncbi:MAG: hypothetical protein HFI47_06375 [Lachnospiraceae bacterium]|jgi:hypothetical protein|nr:hypothetical protein [Lachnospiraceae bacterium]MCI8798073.1 hypothetical protein [Dorea sp.]
MAAKKLVNYRFISIDLFSSSGAADEAWYPLFFSSWLIRWIHALVKVSLEVVLSPFLKIFLQIFFEFVLDKISPSFAYMTTYVELLVRYAELMKI